MHWPSIAKHSVARQLLQSISPGAAKRAAAILEEHGWLEPAPKGTKVADAVVKEAWRVIRRSDAGSPAIPLLCYSRMCG